MNDIEKQQEPSLRILLKETLKDSCMDTTTHAIPNILKERSHLIVKIIWILCFLASGIYCLVSIVQTFQNYFSYPSYVTIQIVQEIPSQFPAVSFCNMKTVNASNSYTKSYLTSNAMYFTLPQNMFPSLGTWSLISSWLMRTTINNDKTLTIANKKSLGYQIEDMLVTCHYNFLECYASDFTYFYSPLYGNCYTFNSGTYDNGSTYSPKTSNLNGPFFGLTLELYLGNPSNDLNYENNEGLILSINNQTAEPFWQGDVLKGESGAEIDYVINRNFATRLPSPFGNCLSNPASSKYYDYIVNTRGKNYSQQFCFQLCIQDKIINKCGCALVYYPIFQNSSTVFCGFSDYSCMVSILESVTTINNCQTQCPLECNSIEYKSSISKSKYPSSTYSDVLYNYVQAKGQNVSYSKIPEAFTKLNIYYHQMEYTTTTQVQQMQVADLFSNFGGTLGLFLGMSFLTFAELLEIGFNISFLITKFLISKKQKVRIAEEVKSPDL